MEINTFSGIPFEPIMNPTLVERNYFISQVPEIIIELRNIVKDLTSEQLQCSYRPGGWTIQQIVHHVADNNVNAYLRFKRALTEEEPIASSYDQDAWAALDEYNHLPVEDSLLLIETLHRRFLTLLNSLQPDDFRRKLRTQVLDSITLDIALQRLIWHDRHHIAHIRLAVAEF
ncbi:putative metal-dependent hydrolase [Paenibacillus sp. SC116]|uniref:YfiT family bacillithiol transferase n=1 Tax=Paenibacillus sp. SC116 TaxID=2968986 RepID=UPI00215B0005|nr:putative metal-dependent hydrolase [Paenibacillus sp. SC116]MCR8843859.1 putative metal-dependent hydrolase [Paenibacillus sp. SC116]